MPFINTRVYIAPGNTDRLGWFRHMDKGFYTKLPRKLKKHGKHCAQREKYGKTLRTADIRITEMWYSTRFNRWYAEYRAASPSPL